MQVYRVLCMVVGQQSVFTEVCGVYRFPVILLGHALQLKWFSDYCDYF